MKQQLHPQCEDSLVPLYQEEFIDWLVESGSTKATAKRYIRNLKNLFAQVIEPYWTEGALLMYSHALDAGEKDSAIYGQYVPNIDDFFEEIKDIVEVQSVLSISRTFEIVQMCLDAAKKDLGKLNITPSQFSQWRSAYNTYVDFIKYLNEIKIKELQFDDSEDSCDIQFRSLRLPLVDEFEIWLKNQTYIDDRTKSNYISLLNDLHKNKFPDIDPEHASPFDLMMPFVQDDAHAYVAKDILQKYAYILQKEIGRTEHFSALNKYFEFLDDKFDNKVNCPIDDITLPLPAALKYDLNSLKIKIFGKAELMAHVRAKFKSFRQNFKKDEHLQGITEEDFSKIMIMVDHGLKKLSEVENMVVMPWLDFTAVNLSDGESYELYSLDKNGPSKKAIIRTLDDLEVRLWCDWLVLTVVDYKKYPYCKYSK